VSTCNWIFLFKVFFSNVCLNVLTVNRENTDRNVLQLYQCRGILEKLIVDISCFETRILRTVFAAPHH
jgi:hypothetical protein